MPTPRRYPAFHLLAKPIGALCNLDCAYCYYLEKERLYPESTAAVGMDDRTLSAFVRQYIDAQVGDEVHFLWQGGEPTLLGCDFFRRAVRLQRQFAGDKRIHNALQTNGVLLDDEFCEFLAAEEFLVGLSLDGTPELHNRYRRFKGAAQSYDATVAGLRRLQRHSVAVNALTTVHSGNGDHPLEVYEHLVDLGLRYIQFIPIVERIRTRPDEHGLSLAKQDDPDASVTEWSVGPEQYGDFLVTVFDKWNARDVGRVFVQIFDVTLENWLGLEPALCIFRTTCGGAAAIEKNGDVYSCDHFVFPSHKLGNVHELPLVELIESPAQRKFGDAKATTLPAVCRSCDVYFACKGECPKNRFLVTDDGEPGLNYLCAGYKRFFRHVRPAMDHMAAVLRG